MDRKVDTVTGLKTLINAGLKLESLNSANFIAKLPNSAKKLNSEYKLKYLLQILFAVQKNNKISYFIKMNAIQQY